VYAADAYPEPVLAQESSSDREDDLPIDQIAEKYLQYKKGNVAAGSFTSYENKIRQFIRHTIRTKLSEASVQESLIDDIIGHSSAGASIGKKVYTHSQLIPQKKEAIEKIINEIDFTKIRPWNKSKFMQVL